MTTPEIHAGAGMLEAPEMLIRQVLLEGLVELAGDEAQLDELFGRVDDMQQGSQDEMRADWKRVVRRMAQIGGEGGIEVGVGYPMDGARYPYISVTIDSSSENPGGASMGDLIARQFEQNGVPDPDDASTSYSIRHSVYGVDQSTSIQVGCWALAAEEASLLQSTVRHLLYRHKGRLTTVGVRELTYGESGFQPDPQMYPRTGYVPILRATLTWTLRHTRRTGPVPTRVTMLAPRFSN